jgi:hypothetical protein
LSATGEMPAPIKLPNARCTRWRKDDLDRFVEGLEVVQRRGSRAPTARRSSDATK